MSVRNRGNYSNYGGTRSGAAGVLRGLFLLLALGGASFLLGFFVIARLWTPSGTKTEEATGGANAVSSSGSPAPQTASAANPIQQSPPPAPPSPFHAPVSAGVPAHDNTAPGPSIDPIESDNAAVQKPDSVDGQDTGDHATRRRSAAEKTGDSGLPPTPSPTDGTTTSQTPATRRHPRRRAETGQTVQTPTALDGSTGSTGSEAGATGTPDATAAGTENTPPATDLNSNPSAENTDPSASSGTGVYRVQLGVYASRAKAEEEAQSARDKGFDTQVRSYRNRRGRRLYRVQQGVYQDREHANSAVQQLNDAGFNASIVPH